MWRRGRRSQEPPGQRGRGRGGGPKEAVVGPWGHVSSQPGSLWCNRSVLEAPSRNPSPAPPAGLS